jgi:hypothetical protein
VIPPQAEVPAAGHGTTVPLSITCFGLAVQFFHLRLWICRSHMLASFDRLFLTLDLNDERVGLILEQIDGGPLNADNTARLF